MEIPSQLPTDIVGMQALYLNLMEEYNKVLARVAWLERQIFGTKSERFVPDGRQMSLDLNVEKKSAPAVTETISYTRTRQEQEKQGHGRGAMPTHLPVVDVRIEPKEDVTGLDYIGDEQTWEYEYEPGQLIVKRYIRPKYAKRGDLNDEILIGSLPLRPIEKGNAGPGFISRVVVDKYLYHLPLDRQRRKFEIEDHIELAESFLCDVVKHAAFWLEPIYRCLLQQVLTASYLQADETPIPVQVRETKRKTHKGYFWVYHDPLQGIVIFDYRRSRGRDGPCEILKDFKGVLQVDGYGGYNKVVSEEELIRAACMAHVRRKFEAALDSERGRAEYALKQIGLWFEKEREAKAGGLDLAQRLALRQKEVVPSMKLFVEWMQTECSGVLPKSPMGQAIAYALDQWPGFTPYMTDGRIELSNNLVENAIRPVALGRKNYLFKGSHDAAQRGAIIYSLIATAMRCGHDPFLYFKDIFTRLPAAASKDIQAFLPQNWKAIQKTTPN